MLLVAIHHPVGWTCPSCVAPHGRDLEEQVSSAAERADPTSLSLGAASP